MTKKIIPIGGNVELHQSQNKFLWEIMIKRKASMLESYTERPIPLREAQETARRLSLHLMAADLEKAIKRGFESLNLMYTSISTWTEKEENDFCDYTLRLMDVYRELILARKESEVVR